MKESGAFRILFLTKKQKHTGFASIYHETSKQYTEVRQSSILTHPFQMLRLFQIVSIPRLEPTNG